MSSSWSCASSCCCRFYQRCVGRRMCQHVSSGVCLLATVAAVVNITTHVYDACEFRNDKLFLRSFWCRRITTTACRCNNSASRFCCLFRRSGGGGVAARARTSSSSSLSSASYSSASPFFFLFSYSTAQRICLSRLVHSMFRSLTSPTQLICLLHMFFLLSLPVSRSGFVIVPRRAQCTHPLPRFQRASRPTGPAPVRGAASLDVEPGHSIGANFAIACLHVLYVFAFCQSFVRYLLSEHVHA